MARLVDVTLLKACELWAGSVLHTMFEWGGGVRNEDIEQEIRKWDFVDDMTSWEKEWLAALKDTYEGNIG